MSTARAPQTLAALVLAGLLVGCELSEVTLTEPERAVVAEAYVRLSVRRGFDPRPSPIPLVTVLLHETLAAAGGSGPVPGAAIVVRRASDGLAIALRETGLGDCVITTPVAGGGTCYAVAAPTPALETLAPGDRLSLRIDLADGGELVSETTIPGRFELLSIRDATVCVAPPLTATDLVWSRSAGAWAYIADTFISGLGREFGQERVDDPLYLFGLAVSAQDTTIVFPREFGVFERVELERDVALALQQGLPDQTSALITVAAVDRNWVNWARGGNFNPSGAVRVPSVRGNGTGVFGSAVLRSIRVVSDATPSPDQLRCPPAGPVG